VTRGSIDVAFPIDRGAFGELESLRDEFQFRAGGAGNLGVGERSGREEEAQD